MPRLYDMGMKYWFKRGMFAFVESDDFLFTKLDEQELIRRGSGGVATIATVVGGVRRRSYS